LSEDISIGVNKLQGRKENEIKRRYLKVQRILLGALWEEEGAVDILSGIRRKRYIESNKGFREETLLDLLDTYAFKLPVFEFNNTEYLIHLIHCR
jgi:hypothetical protein